MSDKSHPRDPDGPASSFIMMRVTPRRKAAYVRAAHQHKGDSNKLTAWATHHLDTAAGYTPDATDLPPPPKKAPRHDSPSKIQPSRQKP